MICYSKLYYFFFFYIDKSIVFFFFFQAEDGIRYRNVTGVQTCALPICDPPGNGGAHGDDLGNLEVVLGDGLADRLRDRGSRAQRRHPAGTRFRHRRRAPPAARSRGGGVRAAGRVLRASSGRVPGAARPPLRLRREGGVRRLEAPG